MRMILLDSGVCHVSGTPLPIDPISSRESPPSLTLPSGSSHTCKPLFQYAGFESLQSRHVLQIALGFSHALLLVNSLDGESISLPKISEGQLAASKRMSTISVWSFGSNKFGQCGISPTAASSSSTSSSAAGNANFYLLPTLIPSFSNQHIRQLACGDKHSLVLDESGKLYSFGSTQHGLLGRSVSKAERVTGVSFQPQPIECTASVTHISAAATHSLFTCSDGSCYSFGLGLYGALGHDDMVTRELPCRIEELDGLRIVQAVAGQWHSLFLTDQGAVYSCGSNAQGQLGRVKQDIAATTAKEQEEEEEERTSAKPDQTSSAASTSTVICTASYSPHLVPISELEQIDDEWIVSIAAGAHHSLCVSNKHRVWQMGNVQLYSSPAFLAEEVQSSQLTFEQRATPTLVPLDYYYPPSLHSSRAAASKDSNNQQKSRFMTGDGQVICSRFASYLLNVHSRSTLE